VVLHVPRCRTGSAYGAQIGEAVTTYTVKTVHGEPKEWSGQYGPMLSYRLDLEDEDGMTEASVELNRKPESRAPEPGERYVGHIEEGKFGGKLKIDFEATKELGGSVTRPNPSGSGSSKPREWKPESQYDPEKTARIGRAHAQGMAVEVCKAMGVFEGNSAEQVYSKLQGWINWFESDVNQAGDKAANRAEGTTPPSQVGAVPPPDASPPPDSQTSSDEHQWFKRLLEAAHMDPEPAHVLAEFISTKFNSEQKARAEEGLEATELQMDTLAKLKVSYEQMEKKSLPSGSADESIPF